MVSLKGTLPLREAVRSFEGPVPIVLEAFLKRCRMVANLSHDLLSDEGERYLLLGDLQLGIRASLEVMKGGHADVLGKVARKKVASLRLHGNSEGRHAT